MKKALLASHVARWAIRAVDGKAEPDGWLAALIAPSQSKGACIFSPARWDVAKSAKAGVAWWGMIEDQVSGANRRA